MIRPSPILKDEFDAAKEQGAPRRAIINMCRRDGYQFKGIFYYQQPGPVHYKTGFVDCFIDPTEGGN